MRAPARDADQRKSVEDKGVGERAKVLGRVRKCILATVVGKSIAWPLRRDDPQSSLARGLIGESEHIARARRTMDGEHWQALHIAKLGVTGRAFRLTAATSARGGRLPPSSPRF